MKPLSDRTPPLDRKLRIALNNLRLQPGCFSFAPETSPMSAAIKQRASIGAVTALNRPRDTYKLSFQSIAGDANHGIPVASHVDKRKVRRQIGVRQCARFLYISALYIF